MTQATSADFAKQVADAHEQDGKENTINSQMDRFNNQVGRDIAEKNPGISHQALYEKLVDAAAAGELRVISKDGKLVPSSLTKEQVKKLKTVKVE